MTKEEKIRFQAYTVKVMKNKTTVKFKGKKHRAMRMCFGFEEQSGHEYISVELADLNGCSSLITVGLEEFYKENNKEISDEA